MLAAGGSPVFPTAHAQSALADGATAQTWVIDESGETAASYNVGTGLWIESAAPSGQETELTHADGTTLLPIDPGGFDAVLINQLAGALPPLPPDAPPLSLTGLSEASADPAFPERPGIVMTPAPGNYRRTLAVTLTALPPVDAGPGQRLRLRYRIDDGPVRSVRSDTTHTLHLVSGGVHEVSAWAQAGLGPLRTESPVLTRRFRLDEALPIGRDTDDDGVPDVYEIAHGMNPLHDDVLHDEDGDGWTRFEESVRGSDPSDPDDVPSDGDADGWSDVDEPLRGADPTDPSDLVSLESGYASTPTANRLREVEHVLGGSVWQDDARTRVQRPLGATRVFTSAGATLFRRDALPDETALEELGLDESELPPWWRASLLEPALAAGEIPPLRVPGGRSAVLEVEHLDADGAPDGWTARVWLDASADLHPRELDARGATITDAAGWRTAYLDYLDANAVRELEVAVTPASTAAAVAVQAVAAWFADAGQDAAAPDEEIPDEEVPNDIGFVPGSPSPTALAALERHLAASGRSLDDLHAALSSALEPDAPLAALGAAAAELFATFDPAAVRSGTTSTRQVEEWLHENVADAAGDVGYRLRLLARYPAERLEALTPAARTSWLDPAADTDGDGVPNHVELAVAPPFGTAIETPDSDGDARDDGEDPCPTDPDDRCIGESALTADSDGDGVLDPFDNCLEEANPDQLDSEGRGIGDACRRLANVTLPAIHPIVTPGTPVVFESVASELPHEGTLSYAWDFGEAAPTSDRADPGPVVFDVVGTHRVRLLVTDASGGAPSAPEVRTVRVVEGGAGAETDRRSRQR